MVALLVVIGGGYGVAGYVSASNRLTAANRAVSAAVDHRQSFDAAPSSPIGNSSGAASPRAAADKFVQAWSTQSSTIASDDAALASAESGLQQQEWLTLVRRGNLDTASARIGHARKALAAAHFVAAERMKEGPFLQVYADIYNDLTTAAAAAQAGDLGGAQTIASTMVHDIDRAMGMLNDPQFPPELRQLLTGLRAFGQDVIDYLTALRAGDKAATASLATKANTDLATVESIDTSSIQTKIDQYYQPYLDTYHSELKRAEGG